jgi:hypothetical protein
MCDRKEWLSILGIWLDILQSAAEGDSSRARALLANDLPLALCEPVFGSDTCEYRGPLPKSVNSFISNLPQRERSLASSVANDLTDYIVSDVAAAVERTLVLVELCVSGRPKTLDDLVAALPWPTGLKRSREWKLKRVADELRSMIQAGVALGDHVIEILADRGEPSLLFNEIAFATAPKRLEYSWQDLQRDREIGKRFPCLSESDDESTSAAEAFDYGLVSMASVADQASFADDPDVQIDLHSIGAALSPEITATMESMHDAKPKDGYRPIAWHNVFWDVVSEYEALLLMLEQREPFCETDQQLVDQIAANYRDVVGISRPSINRRRTRLYSACEDLVHMRVREHFMSR